MRITNVKRGRIFRMCLFGLLMVIILFSVHSWLNNNEKGQYENSPVTVEKRERRSEIPVLLKEFGNFEPKIIEPVKGAGEGGKPYFVSNQRVNDVEQSESEYGMNIVASDDIAMNRTIPDTRLDECKYWKYPENLPSTSVIIVFHNEGFSVLMRTVHTVIDRSPPDALHEVLLVDDFSDKENLKSNLESYIKRWKGKVRLVRNTQREGLIRTRSRGASEATGTVIVFLDAHCEVNTNWLPPLLAPIIRDYRTMTVPIIDGIDHKTFEYRPVYQHGTHFRGIFEWGMLYKENDVPDRELQTHTHKSEPYKSPTHAGGLFAINREYFIELGAYDPGLLVWGGENFELSFKIWQCGGSIEWVPCSRVGHVYRGFMPYSFGNLANKKKGPLITINYKRVIETWFDDEHKEYFYTREPLARFLDMGDITEQLELKKRLKCKSFKWFMENVAYDVYDKFPKLPPNVHWGMIRSVAASTCLDTMGRTAPAHIGTAPCHGAGNNQLFRLNANGQLGVGERCVEADLENIKLSFCRLGTVDGPWVYSSESRQLTHRLHNKCLTLHPQSKRLSLFVCDPNNTYQQWTIIPKKPNW